MIDHAGKKLWPFFGFKILKNLKIFDLPTKFFLLDLWVGVSVYRQIYMQNDRETVKRRLRAFLGPLEAYGMRYRRFLIF